MRQRDFYDFFAMCRTRAVMQSLEEDRYDGDVTTLATIEPGQTGTGIIRAKAPGVVAGIAVAQEVLQAIDQHVHVSPLLSDGALVEKSDIVLEAKGKVASLLVAERTALNFMQRMSGIATRTRMYVQKVAHTGTQILDTRKTAPGLRYFDKEAVRIGGGQNHRYGLFDMILIKDNHIDAAGGIVPAIERARNYLEKRGIVMKIEVEVRSVDELMQAVNAKPDIILLDNFTIEELEGAIREAKENDPDILLEASGNVGLHNVAEIAERGVDYISVGELTHSVQALDLSMTVQLA